MEKLVEAPPEEPAEPRAGQNANAPYLAAGSVILFAVVSWFALPRLEMWTSERQAKRSFEAVVSCLALGPAATDETLRRRAIMAELADEDWPARCAPTLTELAVAAARAGRERSRCQGACCPEDAACQGLTRLSRSSDDLKGEAIGGVFAGDHVRALWDLGAELEWAVQPAKAPPNGDGRGGLVAAMQPLSHHPLERGALCRTTDAKWWLMAHHGKKGATLCEVSQAAAAADCGLLSPAIPLHGDLFLIDGGMSPRPHLFAGDETGWSVHVRDGERRVALPAETVGVTTLAAGGVAALSKIGESYVVTVDGERRFAIDATSPPLLYGGYAIFQQGRELVTRSLSGAEADTIAELASDARVTMRACVGAGVTAVRVRDDDARGDVLAVLRDDKWGVELLPDGVPPFTSSCHGADVHLTWLDTVTSQPSGGSVVRGSYRVHDVVCDAGGCKAHDATIELERFDMRSRYFVASLGDQVAVIWRSAQGDVRARIGPLDELAERRPVPVVEDAEHGGFAWDEAEMRLLSAENAALLLIENAGIYALLVDASGVRALTPHVQR